MGPCIPSPTRCFVHIHGGYWQRGSKEIFCAPRRRRLGKWLVGSKVKLTEVEIETLSPTHRPSVNKPFSIAYGTGELPAMIATRLPCLPVRVLSSRR